MAVKEMNEVKYRISAYSVTSVVVTELTLRFVMDNSTIPNEFNYKYGSKHRLDLQEKGEMLSNYQRFTSIYHRSDSGSNEQNGDERNLFRIAMIGEIWNSKNGVIQVFEKYGVDVY